MDRAEANSREVSENSGEAAYAKAKRYAKAAERARAWANAEMKEKATLYPKLELPRTPYL